MSVCLGIILIYLRTQGVLQFVKHISVLKLWTIFPINGEKPGKQTVIFNFQLISILNLILQHWFVLFCLVIIKKTIRIKLIFTINTNWKYFVIKFRLQILFISLQILFLFKFKNSLIIFVENIIRISQNRIKFKIKLKLQSFCVFFLILMLPIKIFVHAV